MAPEITRSAVEDAIAVIDSGTVTVTEGAALAGVSAMTVYRRLARGQVKAITCLGALRICVADLPL